MLTLKVLPVKYWLDSLKDVTVETPFLLNIALTQTIE